jgi:signal peptidase I
LEWLEYPYKRLAGLGKVKAGDCVVFNYPAGDTLSSVYQSEVNYYQLKKIFGEAEVKTNKAKFGDIISRPVDKRENFIKRCIATPGDTLEVRSNIVYINGKIFDNFEFSQISYLVRTDGNKISERKFREIGVPVDDQKFYDANATYDLPLTKAQVELIKQVSVVKEVVPVENDVPSLGDDIFPTSKAALWTRDNYGPIVMPKKGETIPLNEENVGIYGRAISAYENNKLELVNGKYLLNGQVASSYTFKMDYYYMMGDNRHRSADSRYWGFVPEDHIVGKALFIWFSTDKDYGFPQSIRWSRIFKFVK